jgi:glutamate racemase
MAGRLSKTGQVGILATSGTVNSESYVLEIKKFFPSVKVFQQACPLWVPLIENNEHMGPGADYFIKKYVDALMNQSPGIDTVILACTHYPLLIDRLRRYFPAHVQLMAQGQIVADSLQSYLRNHPEIDRRCSKQSELSFYTTDDPTDFDRHAALFYKEGIQSERVFL